MNGATPSNIVRGASTITQTGILTVDLRPILLDTLQQPFLATRQSGDVVMRHGRIVFAHETKNYVKSGAIATTLRVQVLSTTHH